MNITDGMVPRDVFITLLDDLLDVYTTRVTSCDEIRPIWGLSHTLLTLRADTLTREERQRERANALRGDIYPGREHAIRRLGPQSLATGESIIALRSRIKVSIRTRIYHHRLNSLIVDGRNRITNTIDTRRIYNSIRVESKSSSP
jgi:hypothetical protein